MQDKEHSPEITIRLNPGCKKDGIMHISLCHIFNHIIPGKKLVKTRQTRQTPYGNLFLEDFK